MKDDIKDRLRSSAIVIENLSGIPGYNGSLLEIDDVEADRIAKELSEASERIAQLEAELRQSEWQPIETAPKDGTKVIFLSNTYGEFIGRIPENMAHYKRPEAIPKLSNKCVVVHKWMPLHAAPAGGEERECNHVFDAIPYDKNSASSPSYAKCQKCGYKPDGNSAGIIE